MLGNLTFISLHAGVHSHLYCVISPGSYISPPGGKKLMKRFAYPARHIAGGDRRQSALVIMTDFGWNWLPTCDDKLFNFPPAQPPPLPPPLPLRLHFASGSSDGAAATDSVIRILNREKLMRQLGAACELLWHSPMCNPNNWSELLLLQRPPKSPETLLSTQKLLIEFNLSRGQIQPERRGGRINAWHSAGHRFTPSQFPFLLMRASEWAAAVIPAVLCFSESCCLLVPRWKHPKRVRGNGGGSVFFFSPFFFYWNHSCPKSWKN